MRAKKPSHADKIPRIEVKININMQLILHRFVEAFALILWIILSAWPS